LTPSITLLAKDGKAALCSHLLLSHQCLRDILTGMAGADLALKYPRSRECLAHCCCTDIWHINEDAARTGIQKQSSKSFIFSSLKIRRQDLPKSICINTTWQLLFAPSSHVFEIPLANFFTKQRLAQVLRGFDVSICRHMRFNDKYVLDCYKPRGVIDRDRCGPSEPCRCSVAKTDWGGSICLEDSCRTQFVFCIIHGKAHRETWPYPAEPSELLVIVTSKSFPVESPMHQCWTGNALAPHELHDAAEGYKNWLTHQRECTIENRQWYNQECVERLNRAAGTNVAHYCADTEDHVQAPGQPAALGPTFEGVQELSGVETVPEDPPPPYLT
jgi:hypothetical protein